jgi:vancomycin resistance protein YoaR
MRRRLPPASAIVAATLLGCVAISIWAVLDAKSYQGKVARNVTVLGHDLSGLSTNRFEGAFDKIEQELRAAPVNIATFDGGFTASGASFGLTIDRPALRLALLDARRPNKLSSRLGQYVMSFFRSTNVAIPTKTSADTTAKSLGELEGPKRRNPVDPLLKVQRGEFVVLPGSDGRGIDADTLAAQLPAVVASGRQPFLLAANVVDLPSRFSNEELNRLVEQATARTDRSIVLSVAGTEFKVPSARLRSWVLPEIIDRRLELRLDPEVTMAGIRKLVGTDLDIAAVDAQMSVGIAGQLVVSQSETGSRCCAADSTTRIERALAVGQTEPVVLDVEVVPPNKATAALQTMGIKEVVSTFTTKHKAGEERVKNIHHIADLVRGMVLAPGETFSVNEFIGPRSAENGFFEAPTIEYGVHTPAFGGGISQFATTLFNASFFGGLDIREYKPHSLYIPRYPFGREATLSYPKPDLRIRNGTPYGVLIWPTYTDTSITIDLYSTKNVDSVELDQNITLRGECKVSITRRQRTFSDGQVKVDQFRAEYLPKEGVNCDGTPTLGATTTTLTPRVAPTTVPSRGSSGSEAEDTSSSGGQVNPATTKTTRVRVNTVTTVPASGGGDTPPPVDQPISTRVEAGSGPVDQPPATREAVVTNTKPRPVTVRPAATEPKPDAPATPSATAAAPEPTQAPVVVTPVAPPITGVG